MNRLSCRNKNTNINMYRMYECYANMGTTAKPRK